jgi:tRNA-Thr(GGU) m(6)t(6)A37 methyltransferase TsaA
MLVARMRRCPRTRGTAEGKTACLRELRTQLDRSGQPAGRARRGEQTVVVQTSYGLVPIGWVQSALKVVENAPNQRDGAPRAWIRFDDQVADGAKDLRPGDEIVVLTWLHLSARDELATHPEDDMSQPLTGVFSTCSPNRPNPIGLHRARIVARDELRIEVDALEAVDGTPVVDIKPAIDLPLTAAATRIPSPHVPGDQPGDPNR